MPNKPPLIVEESTFPRSEYYTRFEGTTAFAMKEPDYWDTYHRSESSRFFSIAGGRKNTQFSSPFIKKNAKTHSFSAHTGGYFNPFGQSSYENAFDLKSTVSHGKVNVRDQLLLYKNAMAEKVVHYFSSLQNNQQKVKGNKFRPIVYTENTYPCVLIQLPVLNPVQTKTDAAKYWSKHPQAFQGLLLSSFIAYVNVEAMRANIPIEMVLRASFGHNQPSICSTNNTFRINIGLIPTVYAKVIAQALHKLNKSISAITDEDSPPSSFNKKFIATVRKYNTSKLKEKINDNKRYKKLIGTTDFNDAEKSDTAFENLYSQFIDINSASKVKGSSRFQPVILKNKNIWKLIRQAGDSMGKSVLSECFRQKGTEDWFANQVMELLLIEDKSPIETALSRLLMCLSYGTTVTMNYEKIHSELKSAKRKFSSPSFEDLYINDPAYSEIVNTLCSALLVEPPKQAIYAELDRAGNALLFEHTTELIEDASSEDDAEPDFGSDSEFSDDYQADTKPKTAYHLSHCKLRVCSGMKAILIAHYSALAYLKTEGTKTYTQDIEQMYFEVEDALKLVNSGITMNKVRADSTVLHYDLNHCNSTNAANNKDLKGKLSQLKPSIVILDYTSSTVSAIKIALHECFSNKNIKLVMYVNSGLKNDQGGLDLNPYGEVRVCARDRTTANKILKTMHKGLSENDKLSQKTHEMVRVCKKRGLASSFRGSFYLNRPRFESVEEESSQQNMQPKPKSDRR